jgi:hypothetical protein
MRVLIKRKRYRIWRRLLLRPRVLLFELLASGS